MTETPGFTQNELLALFDRAETYPGIRAAIHAVLTGRSESPSPEGLTEARRLLGYLWTATGKNYLRPVNTLFDEDDPIVADVERIAIFPDAATEQGERT